MYEQVEQHVHESVRVFVTDIVAFILLRTAIQLR